MVLAVQADSEFLNCECPVCGKRFHLKPSKMAKGKNHYCSKECHYTAKKTYMSGEHNHQYGIRGKDNASWKDGIKIHLGYKMINVPDYPFGEYRQHYVGEHRLIAEKYLLTEENSIEINGRRYLKPEYVVHHKNHDRLDNRLENLEVMQRGEHATMHCKETHKKRDPQTGRFARSGK